MRIFGKLILVVVSLFVFTACAGNYTIVRPQSGKVYRYRPFGGTKVSVLNNVAGTCAKADVQSTLYAGDEVPAEDELVCTGHTAEFYFPNHLIKTERSRRVIVLFHFEKDKKQPTKIKCSESAKKSGKCIEDEIDYIGHKEVRFTLRTDGSGSHSIFETISSIRQPRTVRLRN